MLTILGSVRWRAAWIFALGVAVAGCAAAAEPVEPSEEHLGETDWCEASEEPDRDARISFQVDPSNTYFQGQLLLAGTKSDLADVMSDAGLVSTLIEETDISSFGEVLDGLPGDTDNPYVIQLVTLDAGTSVVEAIHAFYAASGSRSVFADPNYMVANRTHAVFGSPQNLVISDSAVGLLGQWALDVDGIDLQSADDRPQGTGVVIAVFDSSPFDESGVYEITRDDLEQPAQICVSLPESDYLAFRLAEIGDGAEPEAGLEHGLFVAGLASAVAPESRIHLIRTLDDRAIGDLHTTIKALVDFILDESTQSVLNLSLGFHADEGAFETDSATYQTIREVVEPLLISVLGEYGTLADGEIAVPTLKIPFVAAELLGHVVVAAAGNDGDGSSDLLPAHYPAFWDETLALGASNMSGGQACFTNAYDVLAPGGDADGQNGMACSVVSEMVSSFVSASRFDTGYGYWLGTSFSSPQAAGLAALLLEAHPGFKPEQIRCLIRAGAGSTDPATPGGVIRVPETLEVSVEDCPAAD